MLRDTLAIDGGTPVRTKPWTVWPMSDEREERLLLDVLHSGKWSSLHGNKVKTFQERFAAYQNAAYAICTPNGTLSLMLALMALDLQPGDEVIVPAYTFIATISTALMMGIRPVFVDIDLNTYNIDVNQIQAAITPKTRCILPVHLGGNPVDMDRINQIAIKNNLFVVEDACQAWGAEWRGQRVGAIGNLGAFSFQNSKNITSGEGGAIVTNDPALYERCWSIHNVGRSFNGEWYLHENLGLNLRMTEWQGAILLAQLERVEEQYPIRENNAVYLRAELAKLGSLIPLYEESGVTRHARHLFIMRYDSQVFGGHPRWEFQAAMAAEGITPLGLGYLRLSDTPAIRKSMQARFGVDVTHLSLPNADRAAQQTVWLAQNALLGSHEDIDDILTAIEKIRRAWN